MYFLASVHLPRQIDSFYTRLQRHFKSDAKYCTATTLWKGCKEVIVCNTKAVMTISISKGAPSAVPLSVTTEMVYIVTLELQGSI